MIELMLLVLCTPMPDSYIMDPNMSSYMLVSQIDNEENCFVVAIQDAENFMKIFPNEVCGSPHSEKRIYCKQYNILL